MATLQSINYQSSVQCGRGKGGVANGSKGGSRGAIVRGGGSALEDGSTPTLNDDRIRVGNDVYRRREQSVLESVKQTRIASVERESRINDEIRGLKRENSKLKGKDNASKRATNNQRIERLTRQSRTQEARTQRLIRREMELRNKATKFAFSGAKSSKVVFGIQLNREYSANRLLGLKPGATRAEATASYRRLANRYHPDRNPNASPRDQRRNARKFQLATEAYQAFKATR